MAAALASGLRGIEEGLDVPDPIAVPSTDTSGSIVIPDPGLDPPFSTISLPPICRIWPSRCGGRCRMLQR